MYRASWAGPDMGYAFTEPAIAFCCSHSETDFLPSGVRAFSFGKNHTHAS